MTIVGIALRMAIGNRSAVTRLALSVLGVATGVAILLLIAGGPAVLEGRQDRLDARTVQADGTSQQGARFAVTTLADEYKGEPLLRVLVATGDADAVPGPPGVTQLPRAGEIVMSPALMRLLDSQRRVSASDELLGRLPGRPVGSIGPDGLLYPDELVAYVGVKSDARRPLDGYGWGQESTDVAIPASLRIVLPAAAVALILPILVFIAAVTRLSTALRDRRLAALRLLGATRPEVRAVAAVEAAAIGLCGVAVGLGGYLLARPAVASLGIGGYRWWGNDLTAPVRIIIVLAVLVPLLAGVTALLALRPVEISPLGVVRQSRTHRPGAWRVVVIALGLAILSAARGRAGRPGAGGGTTTLLLIAGVALTVTGLALATPVLGRLAAVAVARLFPAPYSLLGARRYQLEPTATARVATGLVLAVFSAGAAAAFLADYSASAAVQEREIRSALRPGTLTVDSEYPTRLDALAGVAGVMGVLPLVLVDATPDGGRLQTGGIPILLADCARMRAVFRTPLPECDAGKTAYATGIAPLPPEISAPGTRLMLSTSGGPTIATIAVPPRLRPAPLAAAALSDVGAQLIIPAQGLAAPAQLAMPAHRFFVATDGAGETVERVRTAIAADGVTATAKTADQQVAEAQADTAALRAGLTLGVFITLFISAASLLVGLIDAAAERTREFTALSAVGVSLTTIRGSFGVQTALPLIPGLLAAVVAAWFVGDVLIAISGQSAEVPLTYLGALAAGAGLAATASVLVTVAVISRARLQSRLRT